MALIEFKTEIPIEAVGPAEEAIQLAEAFSWGLQEDSITRRAWVVGTFPTETDARAAWSLLEGSLVAAGVAPAGPAEVRTLRDQDWQLSYRAHFKSWKFGPLHWVPVWERETFRPAADERVLWLDPGMAFGTGNHETTRLCCERLVMFAERRGTTGRVIDAGCGSGILALSAARLGFDRVAAFDNDPLAVEISRENAELNELAGRVDFLTADLAQGLEGRQAELVLANIQADVLMRHAALLVGAAAPDGHLVLSGILERELAAVRQAFAEAAPGAGLDSRVLGEWSDLVVRPRR